MNSPGDLLLAPALVAVAGVAYQVGGDALGLAMPLIAVVENIVTLIVAAVLSGFAIWWLDSIWGLLGLLVLLNLNCPKSRGGSDAV